jgi:prevent-host-death family protein
MRSVSVSWAKNNLSAILQEIRGGATVIITDRGTPVARLGPPGPTRGIPPAAIELAQRGLLVLPDREPSADWAKNLPRPKLAGGASAVAGLLDDRESGR